MHCCNSYLQVLKDWLYPGFWVWCAELETIYHFLFKFTHLKVTWKEWLSSPFQKFWMGQYKKNLLWHWNFIFLYCKIYQVGTTSAWNFTHHTTLTGGWNLNLLYLRLVYSKIDPTGCIFYLFLCIGKLHLWFTVGPMGPVFHIFNSWNWNIWLKRMIF